MTFAIHPGPIASAVERACRRLEDARFADALQTRRLDVWPGGADVRRAIGHRLGWVDAPERMRPHLSRIREAAAAVRQAAFTDVVLVGMGGSSLGAEVLRSACRPPEDGPRFQVLDSVDPDAVRPAMARARTTLFILASKSGSTIEMVSVAAEAERRLRSDGVAEPGSHFLAITDEDSGLHRRAVEDRFRDVFLNPADIGGRFSVVSLFGLVPAALMGLDVDRIVDSADRMADLCQLEDPRRNPGLALGALLGAASLDGRDKLILALPAWIERFALWVEQLVAESTGKAGKGIVPIPGDRAAMGGGDDRVGVIVADGARASDGPDAPPAATPAATLLVDGPDALGGEFVRWEFATAAAGWLLGINPFDEPNVQQAKDATRELLAAYRVRGALPAVGTPSSPDGERVGVSAAVRARQPDGAPVPLLALAGPGDYAAILAYLPPDDPRVMPALLDLHRELAAATRGAAVLAFGPRYLHSTGQLHKGGPNSGVFLIVSAEAADDLAVPGEPYSFGVLEQAQALGDFASLDALGRRALHLHLPGRDPARLQRAARRVLGFDALA